MKRSLILILAIVLLASFTNKCENGNKTDKIQWSEARRLTWKDFRGKSVKNTEYKAMTYVQINYSHEDLDHSYIFSIPCYFICNLSWSVSKSQKQNSQWLLEHEQLHFDIAELHARKIRKSLSDHKSYSGKRTTEFLDSINTLYYKDELLIMNTAYDEETEHGIIRDKQKEWEKKIEKELYKLRKYAETKVKVRQITVMDN